MRNSAEGRKKENMRTVVENDEDSVEEKNKNAKDKDRPIPPHMKDFTTEQKLAYEGFMRSTLELGVAGLLKQYADELKPYQGARVVKDIFEQNQKKNRYNDIICNDVTRVILSDGKGSDYIHANHVTGPPLYTHFICTQGPMVSTVLDFWRMIVQYKVEHIVMLCNLVETGKVKCQQYWPLKPGAKRTFGDVQVTTRKISTADTQVTKTYLEVEHQGSKFLIRHHQWKTWPDKAVPQSSLAGLRILHAVRCSSKPVVVHCSAGIGRTGTLVAVEICLQSLLANQQLRLLEMCKLLRDQRAQSIQVDVQYVYIAQTIMEFGKSMGLCTSPVLLEEYNKFKLTFEHAMKIRDASPDPPIKGKAAPSPNGAIPVNQGNQGPAPMMANCMAPPQVPVQVNQINNNQQNWPYQ